jgi:hypothetical protein
MLEIAIALIIGFCTRVWLVRVGLPADTTKQNSGDAALSDQGSRSHVRRSKQDHDLRPERRRTYVVEFRTAGGEALAILDPWNGGSGDPAFPGTDAYGLFVPDVP